MDGTPDRRPRRTLRRRSTRQTIDLVEAGHVLDGNFHAEIKTLRFAGINYCDRTIDNGGSIALLLRQNFRFVSRSGGGRFFGTTRLDPTQIASYLFQGTLRGGKTNSLQSTPTQVLETLHR